jgi:hypothetical protein
VKEKVKTTEILHKLNSHHGKDTTSCAIVYDWYNKFSEGLKKVLNIPHAHIKPTAVHNVNICCIK